MAKEIVYRVRFDTSQAKREAQSFRAVLERELQQIRVGTLDLSQWRASVSQARQMRAELEEAVATPTQRQPRQPRAQRVEEAPTSRLDQYLMGTITGFASLATVQFLANEAINLATLGTTAARTAKSFEILSGSSAKAQVNIAAIQRASNSTVTSLQAAQIGTQAFSLGLAKNAQDLERLTRAARTIATISPTIHDMGDALTQLSLFASNEKSFMRADQLGLSVSEVKDRMKELQAQDESLDGSQAKLQASLQLLEAKFGATQQAAEAQATGLEKLGVAWTELEITISQSTGGMVNSVAGYLANLTTDFTVWLSGAQAQLGTIETFLTNSKGELEKYQQGPMGTLARKSGWLDQLLGGSTNAGDLVAVDKALETLHLVEAAVDEGIPGADKYVAEYQRIFNAWRDGTMIAPEVVSNLYAINGAIAQMRSDPAVQAAAEAERRKQQAEALKKSVLDQEQTFNSAIEGRAKKSVETAGLEAALAQMKTQKALIDQAMQQLIDANVTDSAEMTLRVEDLTNQLLAPFDELDKRAQAVNFDAAVASFDRLSAGLSGISAGFADFLPGVAAARDELLGLGEDMAYTGSLTEEQAAQLDYLAAMATAVGDETSQLGSVVGELGSDFLESNEYAAALVDQMYQAEAAFRANQITADVYAGITAVLSGRLLILAQSAGVATGALWALNSAQGDMASAGGIRIGMAVAGRVQTTQAAREREHNRRETERVAREQERAAKAAGRELEQAAKRAAHELEQAVRSVPGLFGHTEVTDQDVQDTKLGIYKNKGDEYLRRLRDEVLNKHDWADVSIEEAKAALERIGVKTGDSAKAILQQFEEAWDNSSLFSDKENLHFIDKAAVQAQLDLQEKAKQGEKNILEYFGVVVDEAVDSVTSGGGGGSSIEVEPADYQNSADQIDKAIKDGIADREIGAVKKVKKEFAGPPAFPTSRGGLLGDNLMGPAPHTAGASPLQALLSALAPVKGSTPAVQGPQPGPTLPATTGEGVVKNLGDQLDKQADPLLTQGEAMGTTLLHGIEQAISVDAKGQVKINIAAMLAGNLAAQAKVLAAQGEAIATVWLGGLSKALSVDAEGKVKVDVAAMLAGNLAAQAKTITAQGAGVASLFLGGLTSGSGVQQNADGSVSAPLLTNLIQNINTQIRSKTQEIGDQGKTVASYVLASLQSALQGGKRADGQVQTDLATALLGNLSGQFSTLQNQFYAVGFLPADAIQRGFKGFGYTGLAESFRDAVTVGVRTISGDLMQRGATMAGYVQSGLIGAFNSEAFKAQLISVGELMYTYIELGILSKVDGGKLATAIGTKVVEDLNAELEKP